MWEQYGIMFGWIFLIRGIHLFMLWFNNRKVGQRIGGATKSSGAAAPPPLENVIVVPRTLTTAVAAV